MENADRLVLGALLPQGALDWFDVTGCDIKTDNIAITLEEKNIPPVPEELKDRQIISKGFKNITITDFPLRGKTTRLTFRRRYWKLDGQQEYLKNDIKLSFPGTLLEQKFADFLKAGSGDRGRILSDDR
jgi:hypothetical protein